MQDLTFQIIFYLFALITVVSAAFVVFSQNIVYSAFSLLFTFFGVAALYVFLSADFIAVTQIVVYVGGILVLILFGVMLTNKITQAQLKTDVLNFVPGIIVMLGILGALLYTFYVRAKWHTVAPEAQLNKSLVQDLGMATMTDYVLPFEIASIVLMVALLGAAYIARTDKPITGL